MALLLEHKQVYSAIEGCDNKLAEPAVNLTTIVKAAFKDGMKCDGVARSTILLGMEPRIQLEYMVVENAKTRWEKLTSASKSKLKLNIFDIREDLWSLKLQDCRSIAKSRITISAQCQQPMTPMLPTPMRMHRQSPR